MPPKLKKPTNVNLDLLTPAEQQALRAGSPMPRSLPPKKKITKLTKKKTTTSSKKKKVRPNIEPARDSKGKLGKYRNGSHVRLVRTIGTHERSCNVKMDQLKASSFPQGLRNSFEPKYGRELAKNRYSNCAVRSKKSKVFMFEYDRHGSDTQKPGRVGRRIGKTEVRNLARE